MENLFIQPYDLVMVAVLVAAVVFGAIKGMAWQIASISSLAVSFFLAMRGHVLVAPHISSQEPWNRFIAMLVIFAGSSLAIWIAFRWIASVIDRLKLKEFDRQMGGLFGLAKGAMVCLVITFFAVTLSERSRQAVLRSRSGYYTAVAIQRGAPLMPTEVRQVLGSYIDELDRRLDPAAPPAQPLPSAQYAEGWLAPAEGQGAEERPPAWDPELWRRDAEAALQNQAGAIDQQLQQRIDQGFDQLNRRVDEAQSRLRSDVRQGFDRFGQRLQEELPPPVSGRNY